MHPADAADIERQLPDFADRLARGLLWVARELNFFMLSTPTVNIFPDRQVPKRTVRVKPITTQDNSYATQQLTERTLRENTNTQFVSHAHLIVHGHRQVKLSKPIFMLGRGRENDIILDHPGISRHHAQIRLRQNHWMLFDLNSRSGILVNGEPITETALRSGDVITMATSKLIFTDEPPDHDMHSASHQTPGYTQPLGNQFST